SKSEATPWHSEEGAWHRSYQYDHHSCRPVVRLRLDPPGPPREGAFVCRPDCGRRLARPSHALPSCPRWGHQAADQGTGGPGTPERDLTPPHRPHIRAAGHDVRTAVLADLPRAGG